MKMDVLLGLQWGDEGKGKIVDVLTPKYDVIARFQGGPNAGHTLQFDGKKFVLHTIPSGIHHPEKINLIGSGVVIDPVIFHEEIRELEDNGLELTDNLIISRKAHLILPTHRALDAASEAAKGKSKIGSTLKGISPAYMDKTGRNGLRVGDAMNTGFQGKYKTLKKKHISLLRQFDYAYEEELNNYERLWLDSIETIKRFRIVDSEYLINSYLNDNRSVLAEGAQGTLLDIDFGSYPFVTSSNTVCAGACNGLGVAPGRIGKVYGIFKAYATRVGSGPFPTEQSNETGELLRKNGNEFGATTGRPRRCGWLDLVAMKYSIMLNGVTSLIMTKADVLTGFDTIKICTSYKNSGSPESQFPFEINKNLQPVYSEFPGWSHNLSNILEFTELPEQIKHYISFIEQELKVPIQIISVGPDRSMTILK